MTAGESALADVDDHGSGQSCPASTGALRVVDSMPGREKLNAALAAQVAPLKGKCATEAAVEVVEVGFQALSADRAP